ncbi:hypothetical protein GCM10010106_23690 [Thermopolyspora flexuosa]|jgi:hypothetical protein|uniref:Uncharacterized protein n=1 Tax=Thermopolyspora flexuosa TaxID=103836 RepID=A0A543IV95_9ACTN|nr:hypothetical protein [Thermopolyspora flexuosa]TQM74487.1 hypothetical protein FHX40_1163 [Thermopolyspora flexuosa]GGM76431.1 hypothetical protein GCM10010106_23690 [Thermopolyspora flexuosa]
MIGSLATGIIIASLVVALIALITTIRNRPVGLVQLVGLGLLEVALLVQAVIAIAKLISGVEIGQTVVFLGYLASTVVIPIFGAYWGMIERTRWGSGVVAVACLALPALVGRLLQLWQVVG